MADVAQQIREQFPAFAWLLDDPGVGPLLTQLGAGTIDQQTFQSRLYQTDWWKRTGETVRRWDTLVATDPATATERRFARIAAVRDLSAQMGVPGINLLQFSENSLRFGWSDAQLRDEIAKKAKFSGKITGGPQNALQTVNAMAADFGVPVTWDRKVGWSRRLLAGDLTEDALRGELSARAQETYAENAALVAALKRGQSVRDYAEPYLAIAAEELEIDPGQINLRKPQWSEMLLHTDKEGKQRGMTLSEWTRHIRENGVYGWDRTAKARDMAAQDAIRIQELMGVAVF